MTEQATPQAAIVVSLQAPLVPPYFPDTQEGRVLPQQLSDLLDAFDGAAYRTWDYSAARTLQIIKQYTQFWTKEGMLEFVRENRELLFALYTAAQNHYNVQGRYFLVELLANDVFHTIDLKQGPDAFIVSPDLFKLAGA